MDTALEQLVRRRAGNACEYCRLPQRFSRLTFPVDHVIAQQHGGSTIASNRALACGFCNRHKGRTLRASIPRPSK